MIPMLGFPFLKDSRGYMGSGQGFSRLLRHDSFSQRLRRRLVALLVTVTMPMWPGLPIAGLLPVSAHTEVLFDGRPMGYLPLVVKALLWFLPVTAQREERQADRIAQVARLKISPLKSVAYQNQVIPFTALPTNFAGETIQGVRVEWQSSDRGIVDIDDSGEATCLQPGIAIITCRAGLVTGIAPLLVRAGQRPPQTDEEWREDQSSFSARGILPLSPGGSGNRGASGSGTSASLFISLVDRLIPTAYAQTEGYSNGDFPFDELYSESRNVVGSPRNRAAESTRTGTVLPEGSNFNMAIPIIGLGGRGLSASLTLNYNSRVWSRHGSAITFDAVESRPGPGFSIGFGRIIAYGATNATRYLLVDADGTRRFLGVGGTRGQTVTVQTTDGSHITYSGNATSGGTLYFNDGTNVSINVINNRLLPWRITDSNGNFITIAYKSFYCNTSCQICDCPVYYPALTLDYVTDTMGRIIQFNYDSYNNLTSITAPGFGGTSQNPVTRTLAEFDYQSSTISGNFSGLTVENKPAAAVNFIKHIRFPATGTGYLFSYSAFGMAYNMSIRRQMTINGSVISDGVESASVALNYQTGSTPALTDAPAFTQRTESATNAPTALYTYATTIDGVAQTMTFTITRPDSSTLNLTRSTNASSIANGLLVKTETKTSTGGSMAKSVYDYANDPGGSPQVQAVTNYDDTATPARVDYDYDQYGNVTNNRQYGFQVSGQWQVRRRTRTVYKTDSTYVNAYLRDRVIESDTYDAQLNTNDADDVLIAKTTYTLDDYNGMENYGGPPTPPPGHLTSYNASYTLRGNVTGRTVFTDVSVGISITWLRKIDIFGSMTKEQLSCCNEEAITPTQTYCWALPETLTKGAAGGPQLTVTTQFDFNTSATTISTDPNSLQTTYGYDAAMRTTSVLAPTGSSSTSSYNDDALSVSRTVTYDDGGTQKQVSRSTIYDGWGQAIQEFNEHGGQVNTTYDAMGRVVSRTNPFTAGGTPGPATSYQYDALGRAKQVTLPDSNTIQTTYSGTTVTVTDQVNRKVQRIADGLGRLLTVNEQDASGWLTQATSYTYNYLDKLTLVNQGNQTRSYKYDALSRLLYERIPEQTATINDGTGTFWSCKYTYTNFNAVATRQDARGVVTTYGYDPLNRLTTISYNTVSGVTTAPTVTYRYDTDSTYGTTANGKLVRVNVGSDYQERYTFDTYERVASAIFTIGTRTYTTGYQYNQASQPKQVGHMGYSYDAAGRLSAVGDSFYNATYNVAGQLTGDSLYSSGLNGTTLVDSVTAETFGYDANRMQLTSQTATTTNTNRPGQLCIPSCPPPPSGGTSLSLTYGYQASAGQMGTGTTAGNAGQLMSVTGTIGGESESANYTYDLLGRLAMSNQTSNGQNSQRRFGYDRWGNRTAVFDPGNHDIQIQSTVLEQSGGAPTNRITSVTAGSTVNYTYDAAGNVTNDGAHSYTYDSENRLVSVDGGATAQYGYDHQNRRYKKTIGSTVTHYTWAGGKVLGEYNGSTGTLQVNYWYAGERLFKKTGVTTQVFLSDRLSVRLALSEIGVVTGRQGHLPFGEDFAESGTQEKHHFTSYERDGESGEDYAVNRAYSPGVGRFLRPDPHSASCYSGDPQSWNRYVYTLSDPVNNTDPSGLGIGVPLPPGPAEAWWWLTDDFGTGRGRIGGLPRTAESETIPKGSAQNPPPWHEKRIKDAIDLAFVKLIDSIPCQALLGTERWPAMSTLDQLQSEGRIREGDTGGDIAVYSCGPGCLLGRNPGIITLDTVNFFGQAMETEAANFGITIPEAYALTILHELGHATGALPYDGPFSGDQSDENQRAVFDACFK